MFDAKLNQFCNVCSSASSVIKSSADLSIESSGDACLSTENVLFVSYRNKFIKQTINAKKNNNKQKKNISKLSAVLLNYFQLCFL